MRCSGKAFKETVKMADRGALGKKPDMTAKKFTINARPLRLRSGIDPASFNKLADELEADEYRVRRVLRH